MKKLTIYIFVIFTMALVASCEKDNYAPPQSFINGQVTYQDNALQLRNAENQVELWQEGYARRTKIPVYINQEGTFSANVFDGTYKLVLLRGVGPWVTNSDTILLNVSGTNTVKVPVTPYFVISSPQFTKTGTTVTATCSIQKVASTGNIEKLILCLGATQVVDITNQVAKSEKAASALNPIPGSQTISVDIPASLVSKGYFYARLGVKTAGVEQLLYSPVQKL